MSRFLRNAPIALKVAIAPSVAILFLVMSALLGWQNNRQAATRLERVVGDDLARITQSHQLVAKLTEIHQHIYQSLTWEAIGQKAEKIKTLDETLQKELDGYHDSLTSLLRKADGGDGKQLAGLLQEFDGYAKNAKDTLDLKGGGLATAATYVVTLDSQYRELTSQLTRFSSGREEEAALLVDQARRQATTDGWIAIGLAVAAMAIATVITFLLTRAISHPLGSAANLAGKLAAGDLTQSAVLAGDDATGRVLHALTEVSTNLNLIVSEIRATAQEINTASTEIACGNADLSTRTEATASALQDAAASVEQLAKILETSANRAADAKGVAREASAVAQQGGNVVTEVVVAMEAINDQAKRIAEIIGTIDGIAFQTNILALNAAVEAARAGEQGRGFSVVAGEVRQLAQRSSEASREIRQLISSSVAQISAGTSRVREAGSVMERIVISAELVAQNVDEIASSAAEQARTVAQINRTVSEMDRATQQNAAMVEQATAAADSLRQQASNLVTSISRFQTR